MAKGPEVKTLTCGRLSRNGVFASKEARFLELASVFVICSMLRFKKGVRVRATSRKTES